MDTLRSDLRYAVRRLFKAPLFTLIALVSLAIGIGANTAIFTLVNGVMLQGSPASQPDGLVEIYRSVAGFSHATFAYPDYRDLVAEMDDIYQDVAGARLALVQRDLDGGVETLPAELVTGTYFSLLGLQPALGRLIEPEDDVSPGGHPVVVLGHGFWQREYAGDPSVLGRELRLNGRLYTVIGVAPAAYEGNIRGLSPSFIAPMMMTAALQPSDVNELEARGNQNTFLKGRLAAGVSLVQAQAAADAFAERMRRDHAGTWQADNRIILVPTADVIMNPMIDRVLRPAAATLTLLVGAVLLIACANLASFLLAQAQSRKKEIAVRLALGAGRRRLVRQLLTESLVLSTLGGLAGVGLSSLLLRILTTADLPLPIPIQLDLSPDGRVLAFAVGVSVLAGLLFGLVPALQASNPDVTPTLKDETTGGGVPRKLTLRSGLVAAQVALSMVLLTASALFLRSLDARLNVDPGFGYEPAGIVTVQAAPDRYTDAEGRIYFQSLVEEIAAMPGVQAAGLVNDLPLNTLNNSSMGVNVDGVDPPPDQDYHLIDYSPVGPGFFDAAGVRILEGRSFDSRDVDDAPRVAVVSAAFADRFYPGVSAVGRTFRRNDRDHTIIGVARDAKIRGLGEAPRPFVYLPFSQSYRSAMTVVATTQGDAGALALRMVQTARDLDPEILVYEQKTMERHIGAMVLGARMGALVISAFGLVALLLACIGLYGVVSYAVAARRREVGIRLALGAQGGGVVRMLVSSGMRLVAVGTVIGILLSLATARLLSTLLYGVEATDPVAFLVAPALLTLVAFISAVVPARRAAHISPVSVLRGG